MTPHSAPRLVLQMLTVHLKHYLSSRADRCPAVQTSTLSFGPPQREVDCGREGSAGEGLGFSRTWPARSQAPSLAPKTKHVPAWATRNSPTHKRFAVCCSAWQKPTSVRPLHLGGGTERAGFGHCTTCLSVGIQMTPRCQPELCFHFIQCTIIHLSCPFQLL